MDSYDDTIRQYVEGSTQSFVHVPIQYYRFSPIPSSGSVKKNERPDRPMDLLGSLLSGFLDCDTVQAPFVGRKRVETYEYPHHLSSQTYENETRDSTIPTMLGGERRSIIASTFVDITKFVVEPGAQLTQSKRDER